MKKTIGFISIVMACLMSESSFAALMLSDAFNSLVTRQQAGVYSTQTRGYMTGGMISVHFPNESVQLISMTPPSLTVGCNGISLFKGAFSYISGSEFTDLLQSISEAALGYSFQLALRTLCPVCSTVLSDLQAVAQFANKMALDSCHFAKGLVNTAIESNDTLSEWVNGEGANAQSNQGASSDYFAGLSDLTGDISKAFDAIGNEIDAISDPHAKMQRAQSTPIGNLTWKMLSGLADVQKYFIQSLVGTVVRDAALTDDGRKRDPQNQPFPPTLTMEDLTSILMYGVSTIDNQQYYLLECGDKQTWNLNMCTEVKKVKIMDSQFVKKASSDGDPVSEKDMVYYGFFGLSYALLFQATFNVQQSKPLGTAQTITLPAEIYGTTVKYDARFTQDEIEAFISLAPIPLVQAINVGAIMPDVATALVNNVADLVARHYAVAYIQDNLTLKDSDNSSTGTLGLGEQQYRELLRALGQLNTDAQRKLATVLDSAQFSKTWTAQVHEIQTLIYQQVLESGLSDSFAYGAGLVGITS
jgi:conjugative transfer pilus assembly protein TraH